MLCKTVSHKQCSCWHWEPHTVLEQKIPVGLARSHVWGKWPQAAAPGGINLYSFQKPIHTTLLSKPSLWRYHLRWRVPVSGWYNFGQVLAPGLLACNAQEDSFRHRFHRKLFINGSEAVYPSTNKSGSTSLSLFGYFVSSFSFYTRKFSYCITFRFKVALKRSFLFLGYSAEKSGQIFLSMARALRFKYRSCSCPAVASQGWLDAGCQDLLSCCALKLTEESAGRWLIWDQPFVTTHT